MDEQWISTMCFECCKKGETFYTYACDRAGQWKLIILCKKCIKKQEKSNNGFTN